MLKENKKQESGRSMIEMLGVLAIIGVLSVGGIAGYTSAMNKHRANELLYQASMRATTCAAQIAMGNTPNVDDFGTYDGYTFTPATVPGQNKFTITISGKEISTAVCNNIANIVPSDVTVTPSNCGTASASIELTYPNSEVSIASGPSAADLAAELAAASPFGSCTTTNRVICFDDGYTGLELHCRSGQWEVDREGCSDYCTLGTDCSACTSGESKCESGDFYVCEVGFWESKGSCEYGCNSDNTECASAPTSGPSAADLAAELAAAHPGGSCTTADRVICFDDAGSDILLQCTGGEWSYVRACENGCNSDNTECASVPTSGPSAADLAAELAAAPGGSCTTAGRVICINDAGSDILFQCTGGEWSFLDGCSNGCNSDNTGCIE